MGSSEPVTPVPLKAQVTEGSEDQTIPQVRDSRKLKLDLMGFYYWVPLSNSFESKREGLGWGC